jgi:hypothetical protein
MKSYQFQREDFKKIHITFIHNWSFLGGKIHQKVTQTFLKQNVLSQIPLIYLFFTQKQHRTIFWGRVLSNLCFLAIVLRIL